jgi:hypothetical protein
MEPKIEKAVLQAFNTKDAILTPLTGGLSGSAVYKLVVNGEVYVLKSVSTAMKMAADAGIAPPVYYQDEEDDISITGFINSTPFRKYPAIELAAMIKRIHNMPLFEKEDSLIDTVDGLIKEFKASKMLQGEIFDECFALYETLREKYPWNDPDKVPSHNDLNPSNILYDGERIWIIDWDAAFNNDRYVDLAITANFYGVTDEKTYLEAYFGDALDEYKMARFFLMRQICGIIYAMMMFRLANKSQQTHDHDMRTPSLKEIRPFNYEGQLLFGKALFNEALDKMRSPRFITSINIL